MEMPKAHQRFRTVCVYCSSSDEIHPKYFDLASKLGLELASRGYRLIYGGGSIGLMGALARSVTEHGGYVIGVIPQWMRQKGIAYEEANELVISEDLRDRKQIMEERADAFIALPGGIGTLDELCQMLAQKLLKLMDKPLILLNAFQFYDPLLELFEKFYQEGFAPIRMRELYVVVSNVDEAIAHLEQVLTTEQPA